LNFRPISSPRLPELRHRLDLHIDAGSNAFIIAAEQRQRSRGNQRKDPEIGDKQPASDRSIANNGN